MAELTPEERHRIYLEEKARFEAREQIEAEAEAARIEAQERVEVERQAAEADRLAEEEHARHLADVAAYQKNMQGQRGFFGFVGAVAVIVLIVLIMGGSHGPTSRNASEAPPIDHTAEISKLVNRYKKLAKIARPSVEQMREMHKDLNDLSLLASNMVSGFDTQGNALGLSEGVPPPNNTPAPATILPVVSRFSTNQREEIAKELVASEVKARGKAHGTSGDSSKHEDDLRHQYQANTTKHYNLSNGDYNSILSEYAENNPTAVDDPSPEPAPVPIPDEQKVVVTSQKWTFENYGYDYVRGSLKNNSDRTVTYWKVSAEFFDKKGDVIDTAFTNSMETLRPGASKRFEIMLSHPPGGKKFRAFVEEVRFTD